MLGEIKRAGLDDAVVLMQSNVGWLLGRARWEFSEACRWGGRGNSVIANMYITPV